MESRIQQLEEANRRYAEQFDKGALAIEPKRRMAIITCMDARIVPFHCLGLAEGDAHVIRNAGARITQDAINSLITSHRLLKTDLWVLIHHTDCAGYKEENGLERVAHGLKELRSHPLMPSGIELRGYLYDVKTGRLTSSSVD